jgi:hypothetical protein
MTEEVCSNVYRLIAEQELMDKDLVAVNTEVKQVADVISEFMAVLHHHAERRMYIMSQAEYRNLIDLLDYNVVVQQRPSTAERVRP